MPRTESFGDFITEHHKVLSEGCESRNNHRYAVVVQDLATQRLQSYPCKTNTSQETQKRASQSSWSRRGNRKSFTLTSPLEFGKSCEDLSWNHFTSTRRSETIGSAERAVRKIKEGTGAVLLQSGLDEKWWASLRNIQNLLSDGKTPTKGDSEYHSMARSFRLVR